MERKTGRAYRREQAVRVKNKFIELDRIGPYNPYRPRPNYGWIDGDWVIIGTHLQYSHRSKNRVFWKRFSNRKVRRYKGNLPKGNHHRKCFDYWWTLI